MENLKVNADVVSNAIGKPSTVAKFNFELFGEVVVSSWNNENAEISVWMNGELGYAVFATILDRKRKNSYCIRTMSFEIECPIDQWIELEVDSDFLYKMNGAWNNIDYDERITIPINLPNEELAYLQAAADTMGMSLEDFVNVALREVLDREERLQKGESDAKSGDSRNSDYDTPALPD